VWRVSAISEAGGWKDRTTVEDMDLAVRASLKGWQFLYVGDIRVCLFCNFPMSDSSITISILPIHFICCSNNLRYRLRVNSPVP
jgi:hypothetical protein